nr:MAG TPA: hypothetical protein [Caudoviricetes sp.]
MTSFIFKLLYHESLFQTNKNRDSLTALCLV